MRNCDTISTCFSLVLEVFLFRPRQDASAQLGPGVTVGGGGGRTRLPLPCPLSSVIACLLALALSFHVFQPWPGGTSCCGSGDPRARVEGAVFRHPRGKSIHHMFL